MEERCLVKLREPQASAAEGNHNRIENLSGEFHRYLLREGRAGSEKTAEVTSPIGSVNEMIYLIGICYSNLNCMRSLNGNFFGALRMTQ